METRAELIDRLVAELHQPPIPSSRTLRLRREIAELVAQVRAAVEQR
jgi:hypothetical protein